MLKGVVVQGLVWAFLQTSCSSPKGVCHMGRQHARGGEIREDPNCLSSNMKGQGFQTTWPAICWGEKCHPGGPVPPCNICVPRFFSIARHPGLSTLVTFFCT